MNLLDSHNKNCVFDKNLQAFNASCENPANGLHLCGDGIAFKQVLGIRIQGGSVSVLVPASRLSDSTKRWVGVGL